ncbi:hypothetical protein [Thermomonas paludicola]|uniref:hypothetical protein n=1 Tax=Thermomonas paludicola TaxID=2884874 RepID=UPI002114C35A|nr:hypothetical protein [Thermomonas paludicola]
MNRKLHNSLMAVITCSALLVTALLASVPADSQPMPQALAGPLARGAHADLEASQARSAEALPEHPGRATARHAQQSLRMPFFSFSPRS